MNPDQIPNTLNTGEGIHLKEQANSLFPNLHHLFVAYLHQDWSADGGNLTEVFENNSEPQEMAEGIRNEIASLLGRQLSNQELDDLFFGKWKAGYEPDEDEGETWNDVLQEIYEICKTYVPS